MVKAIRMNRVGGPEVMELVEVDLPPPGPGEVRMRHEAIGLNYIDVYHRTGLYPQPLPGALGVEGAAWWKKWARALPT
jgi:NADPH2:quinone reductase